ncbi:Coenzyme F420 hydrogenase/dehydrogenase, beta subunit C-terminal domain [Odoribacter lunatus]|uniref:Coenzyme F420 hydrogenase/dehydrogenase, beta subunit C-terminal domain n=1 Tax=Odoribacter lunatus TaxID=2941335 RepID=UPI00203CAA64|nr:Coenzyme F420 hydrogenase/dehydrogenase, beta subunit C-terminal domain [Odoribacter lunatus]
MNRICPVDLCTGCMACYNSCSHRAIRVEKDCCGFLYPEIDENSCVNCGLCFSICPVNHPLEKVLPEIVYAAYSKEESDRRSSTSGGASSIFAQRVIKEGGVVYGCVQESYADIRHRRIERKNELYKIKGSKYVQSEIGDVFKSVKKDLLEGKQTLFVGTPCQIAGLRAFLRKDYAELVTVDLVCHGVPSGELLQECVREILKKRNLPEKDYQVRFRVKGKMRKDLKYGIFLSDLIPDNGGGVGVEEKYPHNYYITGFITGLFHRHCCYSCSYANPRRISDVTIGDYWGIGETALDVGKGISEVFLNTEKGRTFFERCKEEMVCEEREVMEAVRGNGQLQHPSVKNRNYELFRKLYPELGFRWAARRCLYSFYVHYYLVNRMKTIVRSIPFVRQFYQVIKKLI